MAQRAQAIVSTSLSDENTATWANGVTLFRTLAGLVLFSVAAIEHSLVWNLAGFVVYGALDPKAGAVQTLYHLLDDERLNHRCLIVSGVLAEPCGQILTRFFQEQRRLGKK